MRLGGCNRATIHLPIFFALSHAYVADNDLLDGSPGKSVFLNDFKCQSGSFKLVIACSG